MKHLLAGLLLMAATFAAHAETKDPPDADAKVIESAPPRYPPEAARAGVEGTTVLVLTIGETGKVEDVLVEVTSKSQLLDTAAVEAARQWKFSPAREKGRPVPGRVRMPVDFSMGEPPYNPFLARLGPEDRVPPVTVDEDGTVDGYIQDPLPIPGDTVEEALALLAKRGTRHTPEGLPPGLLFYTVMEGKEYSQWQVYQEGFSHAPALIRSRLASDGKHGFFVTRTLCDSTQAGACVAFQWHTQNIRRQKAIALPPPATASATGDAKTPPPLQQK